MAPVNQKAKVA